MKPANRFYLVLLFATICNNMFSQLILINYHDRPEIINANFTQGVTSSPEPGFLLAPIRNAQHLISLRKAAPANIADLAELLLDPNDPLYRAMKKAAAISNGRITRIYVNLINDSNYLPPLAAGKMSPFCRNRDRNGEFAWPCGIYIDTVGHIFVGEVMTAHPAIEHYMVHEVIHTQLEISPTGKNNKWGLRNMSRIRYGGEEGHSISELLADEQVAMEEGVGNFLGSVHLPTHKLNTQRFFLDNDYFILGSRSVLTGYPQVWNAPHNVYIDTVFATAPANGVYFSIEKNGEFFRILDTPGRAGQRYIARQYHYCDIPGKYIFHSELMPEVYLHMFREFAYADPAAAERALLKFFQYYAKYTPNNRHRYPATMAMFLAAEMESYNKLYGSTTRTLTSSIFPLALYDMLTRFDLTDAEIKRNFNIATYAIDGIYKIPESKAFQKYFTVRDSLKSKLTAEMYQGQDCHTAKINIQDAAKFLMELCRQSFLLDLTN